MRHFIKNLTLRWRIFAYLLGFCAILLIVLWVFQTVLLDAFYRAIKVIEIKSNAAVIAENINSDDLQTLLTHMSGHGEVSIDILSEDGSEIAVDSGSNDLFHSLPIEAKTDIIQTAKKSGGEYIKYGSEDNGPPQNTIDLGGKNRFNASSPHSQTIVYAKVVKNAAGEAVTIVMNSRISPVNATVTTLRYQLYIVTAFMLILSVFLALLIARRVSRPIVDINNCAKELAAGNYDIEFRGKGFREIGELSATLNTAAAELSKVEGLRRELMANISHDLRTPLALIFSYAEMMHDFPDEVTPDKTQVIMDEAKRLTSLVNDILDMTKLEAGVQDLNIKEYNLTRSVRETTNRMAELLKKDGYKITFSAQEEVSVPADETKITQVLYNLLINAVHYTGADKTIQVRQTVSCGEVKIQVTDTGDGIAQEELQNIWDRYYKVDKKHKRAVTGTGLGLSIVKKVMARHNGTCGVESTVGKGSIFWFSLKLGKT